MLYYHNLKQLKPEGNSLKAYIEDSVMKKNKTENQKLLLPDKKTRPYKIFKKVSTINIFFNTDDKIQRAKTVENMGPNINMT